MEKKDRKFCTGSGYPVQPLYTPAELEEQGFDYLNDLGFPGSFPFTRGIDPVMYRDTFWIMGQYSGFGSAEEANQRLKYLLSQGQTGFAIALDLPTQLGINSDHPMAMGEVGKVGVAVNSLRDMEALLEGIPLDRILQVRTTANAIGPIMIAFLLAVAEKHGTSPDAFGVLIQNEPLKEFISRGTYIFPPEPSLKLATDVIEYCSRNLERWNPIQVCGYHLREAGSTASQEVAFAVANALAYLQSSMGRGLTVDEVAPKFFFMFSAMTDLFEEAAKFRTARRVWANLMRDRLGAKDPRSQMMRIFGFTAGSTLTAQEPLNNTVRVTLEVLAAALGGVQVLHASSYDEALALPSAEAARLALRTQQIVAHESGAALTVDPLGGSYYLEGLCNGMEKEILSYLEKVEKMGGAQKAIERGYYQGEIAESAYRQQQEIERGERVVVGMNAYQGGQKTAMRLHRADPKTRELQIDRLKRLGAERDGNRVRASLDRVQEAAEKGWNTVPPILEAVKAYATIGEICDRLRVVYGEYRES
jgi:methylmalonyl-CoA mutase N-terminal domain/subunit